MRGGAKQLLLDDFGIPLNGGHGRAQFVQQLPDAVGLALRGAGLRVGCHLKLSAHTTDIAGKTPDRAEARLCIDHPIARNHRGAIERYGRRLDDLSGIKRAGHGVGRGAGLKPGACDKARAHHHRGNFAFRPFDSASRIGSKRKSAHHARAGPIFFTKWQTRHERITIIGRCLVDFGRFVRFFPVALELRNPVDQRRDFTAPFALRRAGATFWPWRGSVCLTIARLLRLMIKLEHIFWRFRRCLAQRLFGNLPQFFLGERLRSEGEGACVRCPDPTCFIAALTAILRKENRARWGRSIVRICTVSFVGIDRRCILRRDVRAGKGDDLFLAPLSSNAMALRGGFGRFFFRMGKAAVAHAQPFKHCLNIRAQVLAQSQKTARPYRQARDESGPVIARQLRP